MPSGKTVKRHVALLAAVLLLAGCSGSLEESSDTSRETTGFSEATLASTTGGTLEATSDPESGQSELVLRIEGDAGVRFTGICTVGEMQSVVSGQVPKTYEYVLDGSPFSCNIQKRDAGNATLRVVLMAGDATRSVQQTTSRDTAINVSYAGG